MRMGTLKRLPLVCSLAVIALTGSSVVPTASAHASAVQRVCVSAFPSADSTTKGKTTLYNRQAKLEARTGLPEAQLRVPERVVPAHELRAVDG